MPLAQGWLCFNNIFKKGLARGIFILSLKTWSCGSGFFTAGGVDLLANHEGRYKISEIALS
jgi:hypothetical protein